MSDGVISLIGGFTSAATHGVAHYIFGNPESFAAAGVSEVGVVVFATGVVGTYLTLNLDMLEGMY